MAGFTPNAATTAGYGQLPTKPVPVESLDPSQIAQAEAAGYQQIGGMMVPPISGPASPGMSPTQANAIPGSSASPTNTSGYGPMPGSGTLPNQPTPVSQLMPETIDQAVKQGYQVAGGMLLPPVAGPASSTPKVGTFDESNTSGAAPTNPGAGTLQGMLDNLGQAVQGGVNSLAGYAASAGGAGPHPSSTDPAERAAAAASSTGFNAENPGRINVNGVMMTPEEYSAYMGGAGSSPDRAAEAEQAAANGGQPTAGFNPSSDPFGVNAPATPPDVPNGGPGSPGYNSAPRPEDDLAGWRDYDNNGIDDRKQNFVGSGVFNNPGAIMPGAAGTSPVGGWGNAVNTGVGGPVEFGGGGGGAPSLGGYGDLGGYPGGGGTAGSGGNFTAPGAGGGGFTIPPAPSYTFPDVSTIGGGTGTSGGTGSGTGTGGFTFPTFENPLGGSGTTGGSVGTTGSGTTGGSGVATTTGSGGTGTNPLVGQLAGSYQTAIDSANAANENRFSTGLELLLKRAEQAGSSIQNLNYEGMNDIGRNFTQQRARADQDLINRGLGNTTVREGIFRGYTSDESAARNRFADDQVRKNIDENFRQQQGMVDWLGARNDVGPDVGQLANLASGVGAAGPAAGTATPTAGATTPATTTPTAGTQPATQPATPRVTTPANPNGAFTKSSAPNPTINQPAASPQAATSLAGYGQSSAAVTAPQDAGVRARASSPQADTTAAPQTPTAEAMFGNLAQQWQGVVDRSVRSRSAQSQRPVDNTFYPVGNQNAFAPRPATGSDYVNPNGPPLSQADYQAQQVDSIRRGITVQSGMNPGDQGYDSYFNDVLSRNGLPPQQSSSPPVRPLVGAPPLTMPQSSGGSPTPSGAAMAPGTQSTGSGFPTGIDMTQFGYSRPDAPAGGFRPPSSPQTGGGFPTAPAGPSLMGYPDASRMLMENQMQATQAQAMRPQPQSTGSPTANVMAGMDRKMGAVSTEARPPASMTTPVMSAQPIAQGAAPMRAMESGMTAMPAGPQSYTPQGMPQGMSQVPTNQVYQAVGGIPTFTAQNGQRMPANYFPSLNQYGVMR